MLCVASIFSDNMVFQSGKPIRVFGTGSGCVAVSFMGLERTASARGSWLVEFPSCPCGGPYEMEICLDGAVRHISGIHIGEVFLFAGQSNMQLRMEEVNTSSSEYADDALLRMYTVTRPEPDAGYTDEDGWVECKQTDVFRWSALAYLCGRQIRKEKHCAVGIILCCQGASVIQSWLPQRVLSKDVFMIDRHLLFADHFNPSYAHFNVPSFLYDTMLATILPFSISACTWYQGESNTSDAESSVYDVFLRELIECWREEFTDSSLPFVIVQLADYEPRIYDPAWMRVQLKQLETQYAIPKTRTVICRDICERNMIHPASKGELAGRICASVNELTK